MRDKIYMAKSWYQTFLRFTMSKQDRLYFFRVTLSKNIFPYARLIIETWLFLLTFVTNRLKCYLWRTHLTVSNWYNIIWILFRIDKCWDIWLLETRVYTYIYRYATDGQISYTNCTYVSWYPEIPSHGTWPRYMLRGKSRRDSYRYKNIPAWPT